MAVNIKPILTVDTDIEKLDKVNYNFDQLVVNGGGPRGFQGVQGDTGFQGLTGYQGDNGYSGDVGPQGEAGDSKEDTWEGVKSSDNTVKVLPNQSTGTYPPTVAVGYKSDSELYKNKITLDRASLLINRDNAVTQNNLELKHEEDANTSFYYRLTSSPDNVTMETVVTMETGFNSTDPNTFLKQYTREFKWVNDSNNNTISIKPEGLQVNTTTELNQPVEFEDTLKIDAEQIQEGMIASSADSSGKIEFKNIEDVGGSVPVGTILSVDPSMFEDESNFVLNETTIDYSNKSAIRISVGKGINTFAGWYLCNGKIWKSTTFNYQTEDLNTFSYTIEDDPDLDTDNSQMYASSQNLSNKLVGGSSTSMNALHEDGIYKVRGVVESGSVSLGSGTGSGVFIKRLPQIVYLGEEDLYWQEGGSDLFIFGDWSGTASVEQDGTITLTAGNAASVSTSTSNFTSSSPVYNNETQREIDVSIVVPEGYGNSGETITRIVNGIPEPLKVTQAGSLPIINNFIVESQGSDSIKIQWDSVIGSDGNLSITWGTGLSYENIGSTISTDTNFMDYNLENLTVNTSYNIRMTATNPVGSVYSSVTASTSLQTFTFANWTGTFDSVSQDGTINYTPGNSTAVRTDPTSYRVVYISGVS